MIDRGNELLPSDGGPKWLWVGLPGQGEAATPQTASVQLLQRLSKQHFRHIFGVWNIRHGHLVAPALAVLVAA